MGCGASSSSKQHPITPTKVRSKDKNNQEKNQGKQPNLNISGVTLDEL